MTLNLEQFEQELTAEHGRLTQAFAAAQAKFTTAQEEQQATSDALVTFRNKYQAVLQSLASRAAEAK